MVGSSFLLLTFLATSAASGENDAATRIAANDREAVIAEVAKIVAESL
jgi:hypothetical protein